MYNLPMSPATAEAASELSSEALIAYLEKNGWRKAGPFGKYAVRFLSPDPETEKTVIIPIDKDVADYGWLMINVLIEAAKEAGQTPDQFFRVIRFREEFYKYSREFEGVIEKIRNRIEESRETPSGKPRTLENVPKAG